MTVRRTNTQAPAKGAVMVTRLAPADGDAYAWVRDKLEAIGWTMLEESYSIDGNEAYAPYVMVNAWGIPPKPELPPPPDRAEAIRGFTE